MKGETGAKYNRLTAIRYVGKGKWLFRCDCGQERNLFFHFVRKGTTKSCGCYKSETTSKRMTTHGDTVNGKRTIEYSTWADMKSRCTSTTHRAYRYYGGRGITVCDRWLGEDGYKNFLSDMGKRPANKESLDRIDNEMGYSPDNCRWATRREQQNNTRHVKWFTHNGETKNITEWAKTLGISHTAMSSRFRNMSIERACTKPRGLQNLGRGPKK